MYSDRRMDAGLAIKVKQEIKISRDKNQTLVLCPHPLKGGRDPEDQARLESAYLGFYNILLGL